MSRLRFWLAVRMSSVLIADTAPPERISEAISKKVERFGGRICSEWLTDRKRSSGAPSPGAVKNRYAPAAEMPRREDDALDSLPDLRT